MRYFSRHWYTARDAERFIPAPCWAQALCCSVLYFVTGKQNKPSPRVIARNKAISELCQSGTVIFNQGTKSIPDVKNGTNTKSLKFKA
jgi:hypothetical protein